MEQEKFKPSAVILSIILIIVWVFMTPYYIFLFLIFDFHWLKLLTIPVYLFLTYVLLINSIQLLIEQLKLLRRSH